MFFQALLGTLKSAALVVTGWIDALTWNDTNTWADGA